MPQGLPHGVLQGMLQGGQGIPPGMPPGVPHGVPGAHAMPPHAMPPHALPPHAMPQQGMPQGGPQSVSQGVLHVPLPAIVGSDGRSQMPPSVLPYVQPQLQSQPQQHQASEIVAVRCDSDTALLVSFQACFGGPVGNSKCEDENYPRKVPKASRAVQLQGPVSMQWGVPSDAR